MKYYVIKFMFQRRGYNDCIETCGEQILGIVEHEEVAKHFCEHYGRGCTYEEVTIDNLSDKTSYWE